MSWFQLYLLIGYVVIVGAICTIITFKLEKNKKLQLRFIILTIFLISIPSALWFIILVPLGFIESLICLGLFVGVCFLVMAPHIINLLSTNKK